MVRRSYWILTFVTYPQGHAASRRCWSITAPSPATIRRVLYTFLPARYFLSPIPGPTRSDSGISGPLQPYLALDPNTQFPTVKAVALSKLEDIGPSRYHAVRFEHTLKRFLVQYRDPSIPINQLDDYARFVVLPFSSLPIWHKVKFINLSLFGSKTLDYICTQPCHFDGNGKVVHPSQFATALLRLKDDLGNWVKDTRIGQIWAVFSIPSNRLNTLLPAMFLYQPTLSMSSGSQNSLAVLKHSLGCTE
ncbi:hypothetical protein C8R42DRAFT_369074 [Lentinula raphanica]|nr:hypothetical protein C8R42DRAFT_369074 [Lentinula raphanica]